MYVVDANVLIEAATKYYSLRVVPSFWDWLEAEIDSGLIRTIQAVVDEIDYPEELRDWLDDVSSRTGFVLDEGRPEIQTEFIAVSNWIMGEGFGPEHKAKFLSGADPWIISTARAHGAKVATQEVRISPESPKIKIPNVCDHFGIDYLNTFGMMSELNARI